jgi:hypothetical protein
MASGTSATGVDNPGESGDGDPDASMPKDPDDAEECSTGSTVESRMERLLRALMWVGDPGVARSLRSFSDAALTAQPPVVRTALQALRRKRDPAKYIGQPQYRLISPLVAEAVSEECLDAVVAALGEAADHPDRQHLDRALVEVAGRFPVSTIALMLAYVSVTDMAASDLCDEILASDDTFRVPDSIVVPGVRAG